MEDGLYDDPPIKHLFDTTSQWNSLEIDLNCYELFLLKKREMVASD